MGEAPEQSNSAKTNASVLDAYNYWLRIKTRRKPKNSNYQTIKTSKTHSHNASGLYNIIRSIDIFNPCSADLTATTPTAKPGAWNT